MLVKTQTSTATIKNALNEVYAFLIADRAYKTTTISRFILPITDPFICQTTHVLLKVWARSQSTLLLAFFSERSRRYLQAIARRLPLCDSMKCSERKFVMFNVPSVPCFIICRCSLHRYAVNSQKNWLKTFKTLTNERVSLIQLENRIIPRMH